MKKCVGNSVVKAASDSTELFSMMLRFYFGLRRSMFSTKHHIPRCIPSESTMKMLAFSRNRTCPTLLTYRKLHAAEPVRHLSPQRAFIVPLKRTAKRFGSLFTQVLTNIYVLFDHLLWGFQPHTVRFQLIYPFLSLTEYLHSFFANDSQIQRTWFVFAKPFTRNFFSFLA